MYRNCQSAFFFSKMMHWKLYTNENYIQKKNDFSISVIYLKIPSVLIGSLSASYLYLLIYLFA